MIEAIKLKSISDPSELRLGNLVYNKQGDLITVRIDDFGKYKHPNMGGNYGLYSIPITPEILEKCGFKKTNLGTQDCYIIPFTRRLNKNNPAKHEIVLVNFGQLDEKEHGRYAFAIKEYDRNIQFGISVVENVHELQNLYFALTGEELNVKL
jgi:hypothetical protein